MTLDLPQLRARVADLLAQYAVPSAAIGVLRDGEMTQFAVGVKDVTNGEPATIDTVYQCGSMTKTWTALAFLQLVDEGRVDLDEPVRIHLPGFAVADPEVAARVTPRQLLNHTNGIEEAYGDPGEDDDVYERMVDGVADAPQVFPLGRTHGYSAALGYAILARILEVCDGKRWDDVMRHRLFDPMGLTSTSSRREQVDPARAATGHLVLSEDSGAVVTPVDYLPRAFGPGGNITSTVVEVLAMAHVLLTGGVAPNGTRILSAAGVREMTTSRVPVPDPYMFGPEWALGLIVCDWHGQTVYATDGSTIGQNARLRLLPDANTAIVVLTNGGPRETLYRKVFTEILTNLGLDGVPDLPEPNPALDLDLSRYEGVYERPGARFEVSAEHGRRGLTMVLDPMHAEFLGKPDRIRYDLLPISETHFLMPPSDPLEDTQTVALYDFTDGPTGRSARYLHTNCRVHPRVD
ncbi:MAG: beta-lactamase family protein [Hamadaea sp.]|uniref:serine hydrolase domain-containing protein n=1 Tax=Hamadaea sp. TaxID=2024425 RepID=UPI001831D8C7|nr:serine hydrolase domain-containing protein [Hamadaea sp.]NUR69320.1 beta-lactamase family protein [Hamadaea sp.]NUT21976.1 beta-lactamase family protein [Hamadaea sp.]